MEGTEVNVWSGKASHIGGISIQQCFVFAVSLNQTSRITQNLLLSRGGGAQECSFECQSWKADSGAVDGGVASWDGDWRFNSHVL